VSKISGAIQYDPNGIPSEPIISDDMVLIKTLPETSSKAIICPSIKFVFKSSKAKPTSQQP